MCSPLLETVRLSRLTLHASFNFTVVGVYLTGPFLGKVVDARGPRLLLIGAFISLLSGYSGIRGIYDAGLGEATELSQVRFVLLTICSFITGVGGHAGMASAMNTTAKSFPDNFVSLTNLHVLPPCA